MGVFGGSTAGAFAGVVSRADGDAGLDGSEPPPEPLLALAVVG